MENLLLWGFYLLTFYAFLPGMVSRIFGFRVFKRGRAEREIALTFDDGPDPVYTPKLLDLLARYGAKATFFVVGMNAERHPDLLRRMKDEGHIIGIHNYVHKTNWLMRPGTVKKQIHRTSDIIKKATGERPAFYRPPWGIVNLFDFSKMGYLQIILWSSMFGDWRKRLGHERLTKRLMKKLRTGEVILLHDCGSTFGADADAPDNMLKALDAYLAEGARQGFRFVGIDEMIRLTDDSRAKAKASRTLGPGKRVLVGAWMLWERIFHSLFRVETVGRGETVFHYRIRPYHGEPLQLGDGSEIRRNDKVVELHFDNRKLFQLMTASRSLVQMAIQMIREVEKALPKLASTMSERKQLDGVRGLYGISMIHRGSEGFGFHVLDLPDGLFSRLTRIYLRLLMMALHPGGKKRVSDKKTTLVPRMIVMSVEEFRRRYEPKEDLPKKDAAALWERGERERPAIAQAQEARMVERL